jgi:hypothetical protein
MPFSFPPVERFRSTPYEGRDVPFLEWGAERFSQAMTQTAGRRLFDLGYETLLDNSRILQPDEANHLYGIPEAGFLFDSPVRESTAKGRRERKERELLFQSNAEAAQHSTWSAKAFFTFPFAVAGQLTDPLELAINAIPFVGVGERAAGLARLAGKTVSPLAERGALISAEAIARNMRYPLLAGRVLEATAGNIVAEIPVAIQNYRDQADYDFADSLANIGMGGLFSAGLHGLGRALDRTGRVLAKASNETSERVANTGLSQIIRDEPIDVGREYGIDKQVHLEQVRFDETSAIRESLQTPEVRDAINFDVIKASNDAVTRIKAGDIDGAIAAIRELPITRDVIGAGIDLKNSIANLKDAIRELPDLGRIEIDGLPLSKWIESIESGKVVEPSGLLKRSVKQLEAMANNEKIPAALRNAAREAAETRRLNESFAPGSPAERSYAEKVKQYVDGKRQEFDSEFQKQKRITEAKRSLEKAGDTVSKEDAAYFKAVSEGPSTKVDAEAATAEPSASVKVREMKNGKVVAGTIDMHPDAAIKGLSERLKILKSLSDCLRS